MPPKPTQAVLAQVREILAPLKQYTVEEILGSGAMGFVLLVRHNVLGLRAMKLIHPSYLSSGILRQRFLNEARVMARLKHQHVVDVYDVGEVSGHPYIVMEYLEGGTVAQHLREFGALSPVQAVEVVLAVLAALEAAHANTDDTGVPSPIIHRDVKAENVLLTGKGVPKLGDFGIAHIESGTDQLTADQSALGTCAYMAPEQRDAKNADARADLYSVGVLLYVCLKAPPKLWRDCFHVTLARNPDMMDGVPPELEMVIRIATCEDRDHRYECAAEMTREIRAQANLLPRNDSDARPLGSAPASVRAHESLEPMLPSNAIQPVLGFTNDACVDTASAHGASLGLCVGGERERTSPSFVSAVPGDDGDVQPTRHPGEMPLGTLSEGILEGGTRFERLVEGVRGEAKRRFFFAVGIVGVLLGVGALFTWIIMGQPDDAKETLAPEAQTEPRETAYPDPVQTIEVYVPMVTPKAEPPTPTPRLVRKSDPTPVVPPLEPTPEPVLVAQEEGVVRLILKAETVASVQLVDGSGGTFTLSAHGQQVNVPVGAYRVSATMVGREEPQVGTLEVTQEGATVTCDARFKKCSGIK